MPGLLQTEDCARAIIRLRHLRASDDDVERHVALRMARQGFLTQPGTPDLWVALDESALCRPFGRPEVQRGQLRHLLEMAQLPNITLQVVQFDVGGHAAAGGPFTILRFSEPGPMDNLCIQAKPPAGAIDFLRRLIKET